LHQLFFVFIGMTAAGFAQTQVDLKAQSKNVDFSGALTVRPFPSGTSLPATCSIGQMFFKTSAPAGNNVYACAPANTWTIQSGSGVLTVSSSGVPAGSGEIVDFYAGRGLTTAISNNGTEVTVQSNLDTAVIQTLANAQSGSSLICSSSGGSGTTYTCQMSPTLTTYTVGMVVNWRADVANAGADPTLNIDTLGPVVIRNADGTSLGAADIQGGNLYTVWYDGTYFRTVSLGTGSSGAGSAGTGLAAVATSGSASDLTTGTLPHAQLPALLSADIPNNAANTTGNAATATALAAAPTVCPTGQAPTGILANGNATGCAGSSGGAAFWGILIARNLVAIAPLTTQFANPGGNLTWDIEANSSLTLARARTFQNLCVDLNSFGSQPSTGTLVLTARKNGVNQPLAVTVAAGAGPGGVYCDSTHSFSGAAGDKITLMMVNNATSGSANTYINSISVEYQ
jgi:hypothetical protein